MELVISIIGIMLIIALTLPLFNLIVKIIKTILNNRLTVHLYFRYWYELSLFIILLILTIYLFYV